MHGGLPRSGSPFYCSDFNHFRDLCRRVASDVSRLPDAEGRHAVEIAVVSNDAGERQTLGAGEVDRVVDEQPMRLAQRVAGDDVTAGDLMDNDDVGINQRSLARWQGINIHTIPRLQRAR